MMRWLRDRLARVFRAGRGASPGPAPAGAPPLKPQPQPPVQQESPVQHGPRAELAPRHSAVVPVTLEAADPRECGLTDMVRSGWLQADSGDLFAGFDVGRGEEVLDIGCGDGLAVMFAAMQGARTTFCDLDPAKVRSLSERLEQRGLGAHAGLVASGDRLPLRDGCMSRIIATEVLEHVADPAAVLREMVRVGRPGARYLISVPDAVSERFQQPFAHRSYFEAPNHVRIIEADELELLAETSGLEVTRRGQWGFYWFLWMNFFWATQQDGGSEAPTMDRIAPPYHPLLLGWSATWKSFLSLPGAPDMQRALNELMPKSRVIIARRRDN